MLGFMRVWRAVACPGTIDSQTTDLGVRSSNLFGRAISYQWVSQSLRWRKYASAYQMDTKPMHGTERMTPALDARKSVIHGKGWQGTASAPVSLIGIALANVRFQGGETLLNINRNQRFLQPLKQLRERRPLFERHFAIRNPCHDMRARPADILGVLYRRHIRDINECPFNRWPPARHQ